MIQISQLNNYEIQKEQCKLDTIITKLKKEINFPAEALLKLHFEEAFVMADKQLVKVLFKNLIENAMKFKNENALEIEIGFDKPSNTFYVRDNGIGIDPYAVNSIFDTFNSLHPDHIYDGNGLGLSICKDIVKKHNGDIWAENNEEEGLTIKFNLN